MTISSSLNAGVAGLNVNASKLATISDNIANSATYGYKRADTEFSSLVLQESTGRYAAGGVTVSTFREVSSQGALTSSTNSTDISVGGKGMLPVTSISSVKAKDADLPLMLVTTGSFKPDNEGILKSESGLVLLGWKADPDGTIPTKPRDTATGLEPVVIVANQFAADPTTEIQFGVNLPAIMTEPGRSAYTTLPVDVEYFDNLGKSQTLSVEFTPNDPAVVGASNIWDVSIVDSDSTVNPVAQYSVTFSEAAGSGGTIASVTAVSGGTYNSLTGEMSFSVSDGANPMILNVGVPGDRKLTQLSAAYQAVNITKNGSPVGNLTTVDVNENGYVIANYDTGFSEVIYQIPLVAVANPNGLTAVDNQAFQISVASGPMYLWDAGEGPVGTTIGFSREQSTTDIAGELTELIQTQRAYSTNAKVIQTVDEMLQETTNIKR